MPRPATHAAPRLLFPLLSAALVLRALVGGSYAHETAVVLDGDPARYRRIALVSGVVGPESLTFDTSGGGPYTGVSDGRILKWKGDARGWVEFAVPPRHSGVRKEQCDGTSKTSMEDKCGRPLGLQIHRETGNLYIADAYFGLMVVGPRGGVATRLAARAGNVTFDLTNAVDVDQRTGMVYFTDSSSKFQRRDWVWSVATRDSSGRFMRYDPRSKRVKVLLRNLQFPNGVALSRDGSFVLVGESTRRRVLRYWLRGPKKGTMQVFAAFDGYPDNIKRNPRGEFWVAINSGRTRIHEVEQEPPSRSEGNTVAVRLGEGGETLEVLFQRDTVDPVSEVEENNGTLWLGSAVTSFVGVYNKH